MTTTVSLSFAALTIDSADPAALADCWGKALGRPVSSGAVAGDTAVDATGPEAGPRMILHHPPGARDGQKQRPSGPGHRPPRRGDRAADRPGRQAAPRDHAPGCGAATWRGGGPPDHLRRPRGQRVRPGHLAARVAAKPGHYPKPHR